MNTTLTQNVNNTFYKQRNALTGRDGEIAVLVEDYADEYLWMVILKTSCPSKTFRFTPYQEGANLSQSKNLIAKEISEKGGDSYIGCLDADQSYLLRHHGNALGHDMEQTRYLFHTYAYSRENLLCMPSTLAQVFTAATSLQTMFSFDSFFKTLSNIFYPLFILDLYMRSISGRVFNVDKWKHILPGEKAIKAAFRQNTTVSLVADVQKKVNNAFKALKNSTDYHANDHAQFERELIAANTYVNKDNCCLFVYGHELIEFVMVFMQELGKKELDDEIARLNSQTTMKPQVKQEKISHLKKEQKEFKTVICSNTGFVQQQSPLFRLIQTDISSVL